MYVCICIPQKNIQNHKDNEYYGKQKLSKILLSQFVVRGEQKIWDYCVILLDIFFIVSYFLYCTVCSGPKGY